MKIRRVTLREIYDSRGEPTLELSLINAEGLRFSAEVPSGRSTGKREAKVFALPAASRALRLVQPYLIGREFLSQRDLDRKLLDVDGTRDKSKLGGNVLLGISAAFARGRAAEAKKEIWEVLREEFFPELHSTVKQPYIFSNVINGGAHAKNNLDIQEYMLVALPDAHITSAVERLLKLYKELGQILAKKNRGPVAMGDEGGYMLNFRNNFEPVEILEKLIHSKRPSGKFGIALDAAAGSFHAGGKYKFEKKSLRPEALRAVYLKYAEKAPDLFSIEDPFYEENGADFAALRKELPDTWIVGDDLTVTNAKTIMRAADQGAVNAVIVKPNQAGTVSEAAEALLAARAKSLRTIVSHRSGETADNFIIHLARAANADGVKIGAPVRERISKFNELLRLYSPR